MVRLVQAYFQFILAQLGKYNVNRIQSYSIDNNQPAGFGFDGQYFHLGVDSKLKDKLNLDEKVGFTWDLAHLLQLADKDTEKNVHGLRKPVTAFQPFCPNSPLVKLSRRPLTRPENLISTSRHHYGLARQDLPRTPT